MKLICIDLFCGLGGWSEGFLAEGYDCRGYDIEAHDYGTGGYPGTLILRDVRSIHGSEFKDAAVIVASPPCQAYSYRAMPWSRAKTLPPPDNTLFNECWRIQREASEAAGRYIPMIVENVRGAQKWVGRAQWHYGSYYLWGDIPALMPMTLTVKTLGHVNIRDGYSHTRHLTNQLESDAVKQAEGIKLGASPGKRWEDRPANGAAHREKTGTKNDGSGWTEKGSLVSHNRLVPNTGVQLAEGVKVGGSGAAWWREPLQAKRREATAIKNGGDWFGAGENCSEQRKHGSKSNSRKAASAMIAKIPFPLSNYIAKCFIPAETLRMVANG